MISDKQIANAALLRSQMTTVELLTETPGPDTPIGPPAEPTVSAEPSPPHKTFLDSVVRSKLDTSIKVAVHSMDPYSAGDSGQMVNSPAPELVDDTDLAAPPATPDKFGGRSDNSIARQGEEVVAGLDAGRGDDIVGLWARRVSDIYGGAGDDWFDIEAGRIADIGGNAGDDLISVRATRQDPADVAQPQDPDAGTISNIHGGKGNDDLEVWADDVVNGVFGDGGDDLIRILARQIENVDGGSGNDKLEMEADHINLVDGGRGDDDLYVYSKDAMNVTGGDGNDLVGVYYDEEGGFASQISGDNGNDRIVVNVRGRVEGVDGGEQDDRIEVTADEISGIEGGLGNDKIVLHSRGEEIGIEFNGLDGHDDVTTNRDLVVNYSKHDGSHGLDGATLTQTGKDRYELTFNDTRASMTIHYDNKDVPRGSTTAVIEGNKIVFRPKTDG